MWWVSVAMAEPCGEPARVVDLAARYLQAERAVRTQDQAALERAFVEAQAQMLCVVEPLSPSDVAAYYRLGAMRHFVAKERDLAARWFGAARTLEPGWSLPLDLVPDPHPMRTAFVEAALPAASTVDLPEPARGRLEVDGRPARDLPTGRPWVLQWRDGDGRVLRTAAGESVPLDWPYDRPPAWDRALQLAVSAAGQGGFGQGPGRLRGGLSVGATIPVHPLYAVEVEVQGLLTAVDRGAVTEAQLLPEARLGGRMWFDQGWGRPYVGASSVWFASPTQPLGVGALIGGGVWVGAQRFVEVDLRAGVRSEPVVQARVGIGWRLP